MMNTKDKIYQAILDKHMESGGMCGISFINIADKTEIPYEDRPVIKLVIRELLKEGKIIRKQGINNTLYFITNGIA